jgi:hypothetical protein
MNPLTGVKTKLPSELKVIEPSVLAFGVSSKVKDSEP